MAGLCGDCGACCTTLEVEEIGKKSDQPCVYLGKTDCGYGCKKYKDRPEACLGYICLWLDSQRRKNTEKFSEKLRPDICHVVLGWPYAQDRTVLFVYPDKNFPTAWQKPPVSEYLRMIVSRGAKLMVVVGKHRFAIKNDMMVSGTEEEFENLLS